MIKINKFDYRILISGFFNAGKTTLIHKLDPNAISIEKRLSQDIIEKIKQEFGYDKEYTTTGFDRGIVCWVRPDMDINTNGYILSLDEYSAAIEFYKDWIVKFVELKGVPGQIHFKVVREMLSKDMDGAIFLVDGCDLANISNALAIYEETRFYLTEERPIVIVANKCDHEKFQGVEYISMIFGQEVYQASALYNIGIKEALIDVLKRVELLKNNNQMLLYSS